MKKFLQLFRNRKAIWRAVCYLAVNDIPQLFYRLSNVLFRICGPAFRMVVYEDI